MKRSIDGIELARDLEDEALRFPSKSDEHETFLWESAIVEEYVSARRENRPRRENLRKSVLLSKSSERIAYRSSELVGRLREFYREFEERE